MAIVIAQLPVELGCLSQKHWGFKDHSKIGEFSDGWQSALIIRGGAGFSGLGKPMNSLECQRRPDVEIYAWGNTTTLYLKTNRVY